MLPPALQASATSWFFRARFESNELGVSNDPISLSLSARASCEPTREPRSTPIERHDVDHFARRLLLEMP